MGEKGETKKKMQMTNCYGDGDGDGYGDGDGDYNDENNDTSV